LTSTISRTHRFALAAIFIGAVLALVPAALAAKGGGGGGHKSGGGGGTGTISLAPVNSADGLAHYGGSVSFNISTTATTQPWVNLKCSQNGVVVAQGWDGYFVGSLSGESFGLYSGNWTGGAADCVAYLTTPQWAVLASTSFHVYA
jgi:hypothetical protein